MGTFVNFIKSFNWYNPAKSITEKFLQEATQQEKKKDTVIEMTKIDAKQTEIPTPIEPHIMIGHVTKEEEVANDEKSEKDGLICKPDNGKFCYVNRHWDDQIKLGSLQE